MYKFDLPSNKNQFKQSSYQLLNLKENRMDISNMINKVNDFEKRYQEKHRNTSKSFKKRVSNIYGYPKQIRNNVCFKTETDQNEQQYSRTTKILASSQVKSNIKKSMINHNYNSIISMEKSSSLYCNPQKTLSNNKNKNALRYTLKNQICSTMYKSEIINQNCHRKTSLYQKNNLKNSSIVQLQNQFNSYIALMGKLDSKISSSSRHQSPIKSSQSLQTNQTLTGNHFHSITSIDSGHFNFTFQKQNKVNIKDFKLLRKIGQGQHGQIYQARHIATNSMFALKKINKEFIKSHSMIQRLIHEIKIQSFISHPNIVKIYGFFDDCENIYLILQYMEGKSLFNLMMNQQYYKNNVSLLSQNVVSLFLKDILNGLSQLHQHLIIHRDIKPQNVVFNYGTCKLCDLGCATINNGRRNTSCGTFDYIAPQMLKGQIYQQSVDIWEIGVLAYELLNGKLPFYHPNRKQTFNKIINFKNQIIHVSNISLQARNFIQCLLQNESWKRKSAKFMLSHNFIANYQEFY